MAEIQSVKKAMRILTVLSDGNNTPTTLAALAEKVEIPKPTCAHILSTLLQDGYVEKVSHSAGYLLGPSAYCLTRYGKYGESLIEVCRPILRWLYKKTGIPVVLAVIRNAEKFNIALIDDEKKVFRDAESITHDEIYRTATGRIILAYSDKETVKQVWERFGVPQDGHWDEVDSYATLVEELEKYKKAEFVRTEVVDEKIGKARIGLAKGLFIAKHCVGAVGLAIPVGEEITYNEESAKGYLRRAANEINRRLQYETENI